MKKKTRMIKMISMVLILSLVIGMTPLDGIAQNADGKGEVIAAVQQSENHDIEGEVVSDRTEETKTFLRKDGTKTVAASLEQLHYYDAKEKLTEIINTLGTDSNNKEMITNKQNDFKVLFPKKFDNDTPVVVTHKNHSISFKLQNEILASTAEINNDVVEIPKDADEIQKLMNFEDKYSQLEYTDVMKDTSLVYDVKPSSLKESIVLDKLPAEDLTYTYLLETGGLIGKLLKDNSIELYEKGSKEPVFILPVPYMFDSNEEEPQKSEDIDVALREVGAGIYELSYAPSMEWLKDNQRVLPIFIDPTISIPAYNSRYSQSLYYVMNSGSELLVQYPNLPSLENYAITNATFGFHGNTVNSYVKDFSDVELYELTAPWDSASVQNNTYKYDSTMVACSKGPDYKFDITALVNKWYSGNNYGMMLRYTGSLMGVPMPDIGAPEYELYYLTIDYVPVKEINDNNSMRTLDNGTAGTTYINDFTGQLSVKATDYTNESSILSVPIARTYDLSQRKGTKMLGWRFGFDQTVYYDGGNYYYYDENGVEIVFDKKEGRIFKDHDEQGYELTLESAGIQIKASDQKIYVFEKLFGTTNANILTSIQDPNQPAKPTVTIKRLDVVGSPAAKIVDSAGNEYNFTYSQGNILEKIDIIGIGTLTYHKNNKLISSVSYNGTVVAEYSYTQSQRDGSEIVSSTTNTEKNKHSFDYDSLARAKKIQASTNGVAQSSLDITYDTLQTTITHQASGNKLIQQFNYLGELTSSRDGYGNMMSVSKIGTGNGKLDLTSEAQPPVNNLLKNHGFEIKNSANYFTAQISGSSAIINYSDDKAAHTGNSSMSVKRTSSGENKVSQTFIPSFSVKSYTLSAWIKTEGDSQVRLGITQDSKNIYDNYGSSSEWKKIFVYFTEPISAGSIVYADIYCKGTGTVYMDDIQISPGIYDYDTNLIENGDFDDGITNWTTNGSYQITQYPIESKLSPKGLKAIGDKTNTIVSQTVLINNKGKESFTYGGWSVGTITPYNAGDGITQNYGMRVTDDKGNILDSFEFNPYISGKAQYKKSTFTLEPNTKYVTISFVKENVYGTALFDGAELLKNAAISSGGESESDESGNSGQQDPEDVKDAYGRVIKQVGDGLTNTYQYDDYGNMTKETVSDGNTSMETTKNYKKGTTLVTDESDGVLINSKYGYNEAGLNTSTQQGNQKTTYGYDNLCRLTTVSNTIGTASDSYNNNGLLSQIKNGNTSYDFAYNTANQLSSVSVGGNNLISYLYNSFGIANENYANGQSINYTYDDKWNLSAIKFGSEVRVTFMYDDFGIMIAAKDPINDNYYKYVQDGIEVWNLNQTQLKEQHLTKNDEQTSSKFIAHADQIYDGSVYRIKNYATGKYLDIDGNNVAQKDLDKNSQTQQFKFDLAPYYYGADYGYKLVPVNDSSKAVSKDSDQLVNNSSGSLFNFQKTGVGRFNMTVTTAAGRMTYYFGVKPGSSIYSVQSNGSNYNLLSEDNFQWGLEEVFALDSTDMYLYSGGSVTYDMINNGNGQDIGYWYPGWAGSSVARTRTSYDNFGRVNNKKVMREIYGSTFDEYTLINHDLGYYGGSKTTNLISGENFDFGDGSSRHQDYSYDASGNIINTHKNSRDTAYQYDTAGQLIHEDNEELNRTFTYEYDKSGNILSKKEYNYKKDQNSIVSNNTYEYKNSKWPDQLTRYNGNPITYDLIGNPLSYRGWTFSWESGRQLIQAKKTGSQIDYTYNYDGLRTAKTVNGVTTKYSLYEDQILAQTTNEETTQFRYDADGKLMSINYDNDEYFYVLNMQGDVLGLVDESGTLVVEYTYDTWGELVSTTGSKASTLGQANPFRYRSYYYDNETSLYYLQSRYYDPETGRFINADDSCVLEDMDSVLTTNLFAYCENDPVNYHDPSGFARVLILVGLSGKGTSSFQGKNFIIAANTYKKEMKKKGHTVKIIKANKIVKKQQKQYKKIKKVHGTKLAKSIFFESALPSLRYSMQSAFGNNGVDIFAYFGHSTPDELSVFFGAGNKVTVGEQRWIYANDLKYIKFNKGASAYLFGCNAGWGKNSIAQKIANANNINVYAYTTFSFFTDDKKLALYQRPIYESDLKKTNFSKSKDLWMVAPGGMKKFTPKK